MTENLNYDTMRLIFKYLNGKDLHHASLVCRSWLNIAEDEKLCRGPICIVRPSEKKLKPGYIEIWRNTFEETIRLLRIKVNVQMHFTQNLVFPVLIEECYCRNMPFNCISMFLGNFYSHKNNNYISNLFLPDVSSIKITTCSFLAGPWNEVLFCPEINAYMDPNLENFCEWQSEFDDHFVNTRSMPSCIIFFCDRSSISIAKTLLKHYLNCFLDNIISVWGGILDILTICLIKNNERLCRKRTSCASLFISGVNMKTWSVTLNDDCTTNEEIEKKLTEFKMIVKLKQHSIGFIYTSNSRFYRFNNLESTIFQQIFPNLPVIYMCGIAGFSGDFNDVIKTISNLVPEGYLTRNNDLDTVIMVLTYN